MSLTAQYLPIYSALACETSTIQLNCSAGFSIDVENGFWGRDDADTCRSVTGNRTARRCSSSTVRDDLIRLCKGRRSCRLTANEQTLGDPCNGNTWKYIRTKYVCRPVTYQALVCENSGRLTLACPGNQLIVTQSAFFGRDDNNLTCPHQNGIVDRGTCRANNSFDIFRELCEGKPLCQVEAHVDVYGEPCSDVHKYLRLSYMCAECTNAHNSDAQCEFWANRGNCTNDRSWMIANCRKACSKCDTKPPACTNAEGDDQKCDQWTAGGYCQTSPSYMNAFCRKSCLRCDKKTPCSNKVRTMQDDCRYWADMGECSTNSGFMLAFCSKSCFQCDSHIRCENSLGNDTGCETWAAAGECRNNTGYMMSRCLKACTGCTSDPDCVNTHNSDMDCDDWAQQGECAHNPEWMYKNCWKACMQCEPNTECTNKYVDDSKCDEWVANGDCPSDWMKTQCGKSCVMNVHQNDTQCEMWAASGECQANPTWMATNCRKACQICGKTECRDRIKPVYSCDRWAQDGECSANMGWMQQHCTKSCFQCDDPGVIRCENKDGDAQCNRWTIQGECHANPSYMMTHCLKSCTDCRADPVCENKHTSTENCKYWAANGECKKSAVWMHKYCWQACLNCTGGPAECVNSLGNNAQCENWALQGECQKNPAFMLDNCRQSCTRCKPLSTPSDCFNIHGNDTYCDMYARGGHCYSNPNWMIRFCRKSCSICDKTAFSLGIVGNSAIPGDMNNVTRSNTFVLDEFTNGGVLTHFSAFFAGNNTVHLQIWRPDNTTLYPLYDIPFVPAQPKLAQTVLVNDRCVQVQQGDRIGFTSVGSVAPIATNYDVRSLSGKALYRAAAAQQFDNMRLPLAFSLAANYDKTKHC